MHKSYHNKNDVSSSGFEDSGGETEIESNEETHQNGDDLEKFLTSKGYKGLKAKKKINSPHVDSDEEVYLLRIPKSIDPNVLKGSKFSLNKESKVKTASGKYYMKPLADAPEPKLFLHSNGLKKISPISTIQLEKFVETQDKEKDTIEVNEIQPAPSNLIPRHTIFGAKYVERINLQEQIQQKLQEALQRFEKKNKVKKHKKKPIVETEDYDDKSLLISQILEAKFNNKKSSSADNSVEINESKDIYAPNMNLEKTETNVKQEVPQCETSSSKKKKKNKHGENISMEIKKEVLSEPEMTSIDKKKKKKRRDSVVDRTDNSNEKNDSTSYTNIIQTETNIKQDYSEDVNSTCQTSLSKKKKKNKDVANISMDIKKEIFSEPEIIEIDTNEKKKKKRRRDSVAFITPESIKQELDECGLPPAKKRKPSILSSTVIKEGTPDFQFDISVIESDKIRKKHKKSKSE